LPLLCPRFSRVAFRVFGSAPTNSNYDGEIHRPPLWPSLPPIVSGSPDIGRIRFSFSSVLFHRLLFFGCQGARSFCSLLSCLPLCLFVPARFWATTPGLHFRVERNVLCSVVRNFFRDRVSWTTFLLKTVPWLRNFFWRFSPVGTLLLSSQTLRL